jgi:hypothetical protein
MPKMDHEAHYMQLGRLIESMPDLGETRTREVQLWLGRAFALVEQSGDAADIVGFRSATSKLNSSQSVAHWEGRTAVPEILYRRLGVAELNAPVSAQGAFIHAGNAFDAMAAVGKVLQTATADVLIVDPYMDEKALTDFAPLAQEACHIRLLADQQTHKATLKPAAERWSVQFKTACPLEVRLAPPRSLHDRLILVDSTTAFVLTQSLNAFAARSPASIVRSDDEIARLKIGAYGDMWNAAVPL